MRDSNLLEIILIAESEKYEILNPNPKPAGPQYHLEVQQ